MARITEFERSELQRMSLHDPIQANYYVQEYDGRVLLQISTMEKATREIPGKVSQTIQLDEAAARQLYEILQQAFRFA